MLRALHVVADLFWIGSIFAVALLLARGPGDARQRGAAARLVYRTIAAPAFGLAFVFGLIRLGLDPAHYFKATHYMHAKLPLALGVIGIHHVLGARARKMEAGEVTDAGPALGLGIGLAVLAAGAALLAVLQPF